MDRRRDNYDLEERLVDFAVSLTDIVENIPVSKLVITYRVN